MTGALIGSRCGSAFTFGWLLSVIFLHLTQSLGVEAEDTGYYLAALLCVNQALAVPAGILAARFGTGRAMVLGCVLDAVGYALLYAVPTQRGAFIAVVLLGAGGCLFSRAARAELLHDSGLDQRRAAARQGAFLRWTNVGALAGPLFAMLLIACRAVELGFVGCSLVAVVSAAVLWRAMPSVRRTAHDKASAGGDFQEAVKLPSRSFWGAHLIATVPLALAASASIVVAYLFADLLHRPDLVAAGQLARSGTIILLQTWAGQFFLLQRNISVCLAMFALIGVAAIGTALADTSLYAVWYVAIVLASIQISAASVVSGVRRSTFGHGGGDGVWRWSVPVLAAASLVLLPVLPKLVVGLHLVLSGAGPQSAKALVPIRGCPVCC